MNPESKPVCEGNAAKVSHSNQVAYKRFKKPKYYNREVHNLALLAQLEAHPIFNFPKIINKQPDNRTITMDYIEAIQKYQDEYEFITTYPDLKVVEGYLQFSQDLMEKGIYLNDIEFLVTPEGKIYIIDFDKLGMVQDGIITIPDLKSIEPIMVKNVLACYQQMMTERK